MIYLDFDTCDCIPDTKQKLDPCELVVLMLTRRYLKSSDIYPFTVSLPTMSLSLLNTHKTGAGPGFIIGHQPLQGR